MSTFVHFRKDFLATHAAQPQQAEAPAAAPEEDVDMMSEIGRTEDSADQGKKDVSEKDVLCANLIATAALNVSKASVDALTEATKGDAHFRATAAMSMGQASLEIIGDTDEHPTSSALLQTAAQAADFQSSLLQQASDNMRRKETGKEDRDEDLDYSRLTDADGNYIIGASAQDLVEKPRGFTRSQQSLSSSKSDSINKGVTDALAMFFNSAPSSNIGTSGGYLTMDDLRNVIVHQGMPLRCRRFPPGTLPKMPKKRAT